MEETKRARSARFIRDVAVNVLANLIAAAIVYIGGVAFGLFPRSPAAFALAIYSIFAAVTAGAVVLTGALNDDRRSYGVMFIGLGGLVATARPAGVDIGMPWWQIVVLAVAFVVGGVGWLWLISRVDAAQSRARRRIKGLEWVRS